MLDNVVSADWSRDGKLAVSRILDGKCRLEFPAGKVLLESNGYIDNVRFSPANDSIAFMDHPFTGDDRGTVGWVDLKGNKRTLTPEWEGELGLAWSPDGKEVWFTATNSGEHRSLLPLPSAARAGSY
jgi:sugar lactone lactonase YvrE